jgi:ribulose-phosphate 3-epimerase
MKFTVSASLLSADFFNLKREIERVESIENSWLHVDVMDGNFVPQISFGSGITKDIRKNTNLPIDVHLMVKDPESQIKQFADARVDYLTFHIEESHFPLRLINVIKSYGIHVGISLNPFASLETIKDLIPFIDLLLIMSVEPGFSGQQFIPKTKQKIELARTIRKNGGLSFLISVDGGISEENALEIISSGADILVIGSYFFDTPFDRVKTFIEKLRKTSPL